MINSINEYLDDIEIRVNHQHELFKKYKNTILTIKSNIPGDNKNIALSDNISNFFNKDFFEIYKDNVIYSEKYENLEGITYIYILNIDAFTLKKEVLILEEEHEIGRLVDIDVYDSELKPISRVIFNEKPRKCFLCNENAKICARSKAHDKALLLEFIENKFREYFARTISKKALKALLYEVLTYPSFGLVSHINKGAHKDMDVYTFLESGFAIEDAFFWVCKLSYSDLPLETCFYKSREIGKIAEKKMFTATKKINTHKGLIFLMLILLIAISKSFYEKKTLKDLKGYIEEIGKDILKDFDNLENKEKLTNGEKIYINHKITGVRGEIKEGLSKIFDEYLPYYKEVIKTKTRNEANYLTLVKLMSKTDDTTIINRQGVSKLKEIKEKAKNLKEDLESIMKFENYCILENISPGGSADLLSLIILLDMIY